MRAADDRANAPRLTLAARFTGLFAVALVLGLASSFLAGDLEHLWWRAGTVIAAFTMLFTVRFSPIGVRRLLYGCALFWSIGLATATLWAGYETLAGFVTRGRSSLFFANPNLLGSSLAMAGTVFLLFQRRAWAALSILVFAPALLLTGSRTALVAYLSAWCLWLLISKEGRFYLLGGGFLVLGGVTAWGGFFHEVHPKEPANLLIYSDTLTHSAWSGRYASDLKLEQVPIEAPDRQGKVFHLQGRSDPQGAYPRLVLFQNVQPSELGVRYVASVYLRSDRPQTVRFGSNMTDRTCKVTRHWQRCVAPIAVGNGKIYVGLHLSTPEPGEQLEIYIWGAQLERGTQPTPSEPTSKHPLLDFLQNSFATRLDPLLWLQDSTVRTRQATYQAAWTLFLAKPLAGHGLETFAAATPVADRHAHNLILQLLAESGVLGLFAWFVPAVGVPALLWRNGWQSLSPLLLGVVLLNLTDLSYYHYGVYYLYWLTLGLIWVDVQGTPP